MESITWSKLFSEMVSTPLTALRHAAEVMQHNLVENWDELLIIILAFWLGRWLVFNLVEIIIPRSISSTPPTWARITPLNSWRNKVHRQSFSSRRVYRARAVVSLTKRILDPLMASIAFLTVFGKLGIGVERETFTWLIGGLSIAFALGAQGIVKDVVAGITVIMADAYAVGDYIDAQFGASGVVRSIGLRLTELEAPDGTIWFVRHSEISKIGNRTASRGMMVTDVTVTWQDEEKRIQLEDLRFVEVTLDSAIRELGVTLDGVDRVAREAGEARGSVPMKDIAAVIPDLVPTMKASTLWEMKNRKEVALDDTGVYQALKVMPGRVPQFNRIESLGLINSSRDSLTLRVRITLPPNTSRARGTAVLRRAVFEAFIVHGITVQFDDAPEGSVITTGIDHTDGSL